MSLRFAQPHQYAARPARGETGWSANEAARDLGPADDISQHPAESATRVLDVIASALLLAILAPLLVLTAVLLSISSGKSALFWRHRVNSQGRIFRRYEFETLKPARDEKGRVLTVAQRSSVVGDIMRCAGIDRLPQLINILRGEMSFRDLGSRS